ncbi:RNA-binding protein MEX3D [Pelodytes ibericus]
MQEPRGEEELGGQGPRGPHNGVEAEEVPSSRGPQNDFMTQEDRPMCGPQMPCPNHVPPKSSHPQTWESNYIESCLEPSIAGLSEPPMCTDYLEIDTENSDPYPLASPEPSNNQIHQKLHPCLWAQKHSLNIGFQELNPIIDEQEPAPNKSHHDPTNYPHCPQKPTHHLGPQTACIQLGSLEPPLRHEFPDLQIPLNPQESPLPLSGTQNRHHLLEPQELHPLSAPDIPHMPGFSESHVHLGQEEPTDEAFPLLVDPFSVLGLQVDQDEEPGSEEVSGTPSPEPEDMFGGIPAEHLLGAGVRRRGVNMTEGVPVPGSEHVAEIVGRQGCKIKALRAKTNTYIKTPVRGEEPIFIVTGRKEDVEMAKREILAAADHFSIIRATRNKNNVIPGASQAPPNLPGQTTIQVRVPYRVVGLVVGPKGATIKRIQQSTHTYIVTPSRDKEPVFEVTGMPENVDRAREEIEAHITMRTGSLVDVHPDNDFHSNGTDVGMELLAGGSGSLWGKVPAPRRGSGASHNESIGSCSSESPYYGTTGREPGPASPFRPILGGGFTLGDPHPVPAAMGTDDCEFGFEFLALDLNTPTAIWSPFETTNGQLQNVSGSTAQRRNSGLSGNTTPRISPTLAEPVIGLEHPLARRIHSDPVSGMTWLPTQGSLSSFSSSTGYSSSSSLPGSSSVASGSPTDSSSSDGQRKSGRDCVVCYESEVIAALVPCGHNLFCMECAIRICERVLPECPACHAPATQAIRIFS